jgi:hypothetical protein
MIRAASPERDDEMMRRASEVGDGMGMGVFFDSPFIRDTARLERALEQLGRDCKAYVRARPVAVLVVAALVGVVAARLAR